eukprot:11730189-Prorocentrum_lima.AAC.1
MGIHVSRVSEGETPQTLREGEGLYSARGRGPTVGLSRMRGSPDQTRRGGSWHGIYQSTHHAEYEQ